jgi:hypothetical protein
MKLGGSLKILTLVPVLNQMNPFHFFPTYFPKIHFNIILSSTPSSSKQSLPFRLSKQNIDFTSHVSHACYVSRQSHTPQFYHPNNIWWGEQFMKLHATQSSPSSCHFLFLGVQVFSSAPCSHTPSIYVLPSVRESKRKLENNFPNKRHKGK